MRVIVKHTLTLMFSFFILFSALFALSYAVYPDPLWVDTEQSSETAFKASRTIYIGEPRHVVLGRKPLGETSRKILLVGSSNVREGFRPELIGRYLPGYRVHNLAVGASNISQIREILSLADEYCPSVSPGEDAGNVVVLGVWYGLFVDDRTRWKGGKTDIANEELRFGLYKASPSGALEPTVPRGRLDLFIGMLRPYLLMDKVVSRCAWLVRHWLACWLPIGMGCYAQDMDRDTVVIDESMRSEAMKFWQDYMGRETGGALRDEQFLALQDVAATLSRQGKTLVIVDLPIAKWHARQSEHFRNYQMKKKPFINRLVHSYGVRYLNLQDMDNESDFYDSAHPRPAKAVRWSSCLGEALQGMITAGRPDEVNI